MILAGDVGATKILLEAGDFSRGRWQPALARRYLIAEHPNFSAVVGQFLDELGGPGGHPRIEAAAIGAAGLVTGNKVTMTNRAWTVDGDAVSRRLEIPKVAVLNDLAAAAQGVDVLDRDQFMTIQPGEALPDAPRVVLGIGTGLGVAYLVPGKMVSETKLVSDTNSGSGKLVSDTNFVVPGEGGHMGFSPSSAEQAALWQAMMATRPRVEAEDVCSGLGLANIYEFLRRGGDCPAGAPERADGAWIARHAEQGEQSCIKALDLFAECLGNVAGDHALTVMARGGVILAGGVVAKLASMLNQERFRAAFCAKGHFSAELMKIPVSLATSERIALIGAARVAHML